MLAVSRVFPAALALAGVLAPGASAENPTFSMEAVAVNSRELEGGPVSVFHARPGDVITVRINLRDWSPNGERLNAYQAQIEPMDFTTGSSGNVQPVNYTKAREEQKMNLDNALIEQSDPDWIFAGKQTVSLVDTRSAGYRWMSVLADTSDANVHEQDGRKFYAGTLLLKASDDARGRFILGYIEDPSASLLLDERGLMINPLEFELLTVVVLPDVLGAIARLNGADAIPLERADIDGNGELAYADVQKGIEMLNQPPAGRVSADAPSANAGAD